MSEKKLPKGWNPLPLEEISDFVIGGDWGLDPESDILDDYVPVACIRGSEIKNWRVDKGKTASIRLVKKNSLEKRQLRSGDLLIEISGGGPDQPVGRVILIDEEALAQNIEYPKIGTNFLRLIRLKDSVNSHFVNHYLQIFYLTGKIIEYQGGSNNLRNLKYKEFSKIEIPLPPLPEQQRIVARLDAVFGHLDVLREKLDRIPGLLKNFRQQVLTQAVTGELTREWREGKGLEEWVETTLNDVIEFSSNGLSKRAGTIGKEVTVLRLADFKNGIRVYGNERTIILDEKEKRKYVLGLHDLLVIRVNGSADLAGLFIYYDEIGPEEAYCDHFIRIKVSSSKLISKFLTFITNSGEGRKYLRSSLSTSAGQNTINQKSIGNLILNLPPIQEQEEIIKQVQALFILADKIESQYLNLKAKIEQLPQAVLAKAFRGELVEREVKDYVREEGEVMMAGEGERNNDLD